MSLPIIQGVGRITIHADQIFNNSVDKDKFSNSNRAPAWSSARLEDTQDTNASWLAVDNGILFWYASSSQEIPLGYGVIRSSVEYQERQIYPLDKVMTCKLMTHDGEVTANIAIINDEAKTWFEILNKHYQSFDRDISIESIHKLFESYDFLNASSMKSVSASMQITLKGQEFVIQVGIHDDIPSMAEAFIKQHNLKPDLAIRIENELLKTQIDAYKIYESNTQKKLAVFRRRLTDVLIAENKQHLAEKHANNLNEVIEKLNKSVNEIEEVYDTTKQKTVNQYILVQQLQDEIAKSYAENIELQSILHDEETSSQRKIKDLSEEVKSLKDKLSSVLNDEAIDEYGAYPQEYRDPQSSSTPTRGSTRISTSAMQLSSQYGRQMVPKDARRPTTIKQDPQMMVREVAELRREKALLSKRLLQLQEENKKSAFNLQQEINKRVSLQNLGILPYASSESEVIGSMIHYPVSSNNSVISGTGMMTAASIAEDNIHHELIQKVKLLDEKNKKLSATNRQMEISNKTLQMRVTSLQSHTITLTDQLQQRNDIIDSAGKDLSRYKDMLENYGQMAKRTRNLKQSIVSYKGKCIRFEIYIRQLKDSMSYLIQYIQMWANHLKVSWPVPLESETDDLYDRGSHPANMTRNMMDHIDLCNELLASDISLDGIHMRDEGEERSVDMNDTEEYIDTNQRSSFLSPENIQTKDNQSAIRRLSKDSGRSSSNVPYMSPINRQALADMNMSPSMKKRIILDPHEISSKSNLPLYDGEESAPNKQTTAWDVDQPYTINSDLSYQDHSTLDADDLQMESILDYHQDISSKKMLDLLTPVVEDRLLRQIYGRYNISETGTQPRDGMAVLTLTRYIRFVRDFEFISHHGNGVQGNYLVPGEVDMIFINATKSQVNSNHHMDNKKATDVRKKPFRVSASCGLLSVYPSNETLFLATEAANGRVMNDGTIQTVYNVNKPNSLEQSQQSVKFPTISPGTVLSERQFTASIEQLSIKMYWKDIEKKYGAVYECLTPKQQNEAARYAFELSLQRKIIPIAERLGLIPWSLIHFDQVLSSLLLKGINYHSLSIAASDVRGWMDHYIANYHIHTGQVYSDDNSSEQPGRGKVKTIARRGSIMSYPLFSIFSYDFGIIPYLLKESQLFSIFQEIILWGRTDATTLLDTLPQPYLVDEGSRGVSNDRVNNLYDSIVLPSFDRSKSSSKQGPVPTMKQLLLSINHSNSLSSNDPNSGIPSQEIIGLTMPGFAFALVTIASQSFPDKAIDERLDELLKWMMRSGGAEKINYKKSKLTQ